MGRSNNPKKFFTEREQEEIMAAITAAENRTSGEIRLHVEGKCPTDEPLEHAQTMFLQLEMDKTASRNGVLIYLATASRRFAILGDEGIDQVVPDNFWEDVKNVMATQFQEGRFCEGMVEGVARVGEKLREFFPWQSDDVNELTDEISFGKKTDGPIPDSD
jgi:uncharacterized membrane protein